MVDSQHIMSTADSENQSAGVAATPSASPSMSTSTSSSSTSLMRVLPAAGLLLAIFVLLFWEFLYRQVRWAIEAQADWGHTLVIPFLAGYLVYLNREALLAKPFRTTWLGLVPMVLGVAVYFFCSIGPKTVQHHNLQGFGVWLTLAGITLLFCGWRSMRWLWFPLVFVLVFGQTISERLLSHVTFRMQDITAWGSHIAMSMGGMDIDRSGNTLTIHHNGEAKPLNIAEACSGMRMLMAFLALAVFMAYTGLKRLWQQITLVILAVPTSIFVNILRVVTLGIFSLFDVEFASGDFHTFIGLIWLVPAFLIFLGLMWALTHVVIEEQPQPASVKASSAHAKGGAAR